MRWSEPAGKSRHRQIGSPPEEMDRAALANEAGAENFKNPVALQEHAPEAIGVIRVI